MDTGEGGKGKARKGQNVAQRAALGCEMGSEHVPSLYEPEGEA